MEKHDLIEKLLALEPADLREILVLLQERVAKDTANREAGEPRGERPVPAPKSKDPWGSVYQELSKTFRRVGQR